MGVISSHTWNYLQEKTAKVANTHVGGNQKRYQQSTTVDQKSLETVLLIAICRQCGDKWQSKTLFLKIFDLHSSIVLAFLIAAYPLCCLSLVSVYATITGNKLSHNTWANNFECLHKVHFTKSFTRKNTGDFTHRHQ